MAKVDHLWEDETCEALTAENLESWVTVQGIRRAYEKEGKTDTALMKSVIALAFKGFDLPSCFALRLMGVYERMADQGLRSWDQVIGPLRPKGSHTKKRKELPEPSEVWGRVYLLMAAEGKPLTVSTFEEVGEKFGIGSKTVQKLYSQYAKEFSCSLAGYVFSEGEIDRAKKWL